ncbi:response regulator transcription factor [Paenibacillus hamazuiensis]|uniref:response regulator transcription factor n=1 Tax=Paenibacillus hamazuiensis TaxID=2936508 RepID=UPI00200F7C18|nr:response regulator [Paenibacillus hamazuiensis]
MIKVIVVDDEVWVRKGIVKAIDWERHGLQLAGEAADGEDAYALALQLMPHIMLIDMRMPGMDGRQLLRLLKERFPQMIAIVISGYSHFEYTREAILQGAFDYVLKPIKKTELAQTLQKAAEEARRRFGISAASGLRAGDKGGDNPVDNPGSEGFAKAGFDGTTGAGGGAHSGHGWTVGPDETGRPASAALGDAAGSGAGRTTGPNRPDGSEFGCGGAVAGGVSAAEIRPHLRRRQPSIVESIVLDIMNEYDKPLALSDFARKYHINPDYLSRLFKKETGKTFSDFVTECRIGKAKELLERTNYKYFEISNLVGYEDYRHFSQVFKRSVGMTPGEYKHRTG